MDSFVIAILAVAIGVLAVLVVTLYRRKSPQTKTTIDPFIESMKSIGELSVYRIVMREIITQEDHAFGQWGSKYLRWLVSTKKIALVLQFDIEFRYDLCSDAFLVAQSGPDTYRVTLPPCSYVPYTRRVRFYDEQNSRFIPWLLPGLLSEFLGGRFTEQEKNGLIEEAEASAQRIAAEAVGKHQSAIRESARRTLLSISRAFGARDVSFDFAPEAPLDVRIEFESEPKAA